MGKGKMKQPGLDKRIRDTFISSDADSIGDFLLDEVVIPGIKNMLLKAGHGIVDSIFGNYPHYGSSYSYRRRYDDGASYNNNHRRHRDRDDGRSDYSRRSNRNSKRSSKEIDVETWQDAEEINSLIAEVFDRKKELSFFDLVAILEDFDIDTPSTDYTDNEWGWDDISGFKTNFRANGKAIITIPRQEYLK